MQNQKNHSESHPEPLDAPPHIYDAELKDIDDLVLRLNNLLNANSSSVIEGDSFPRVIKDFYFKSFSSFIPVNDKIAEFQDLLKNNRDLFWNDSACLFYIYLSHRDGLKHALSNHETAHQIYLILLRAVFLHHPLAMRTLAHYILLGSPFQIDNDSIQWALDCISYLEGITLLDAADQRELIKELKSTKQLLLTHFDLANIPAKNSEDYQNVVKRITKALSKSHPVLKSTEGEEINSPIRLNMTRLPISWSDSEIKPLVSVDVSNSTSKILRSLPKVPSASNEAFQANDPEPVLKVERATKAEVTSVMAEEVSNAFNFR